MQNSYVPNAGIATTAVAAMNKIMKNSSEIPKNPHAKALGRLGGKVKSEKKAASSRKNGKLGGRPKKKPE